MLSEKFGRDVRLHGFISHRLSSIFAEFERGTMFGVRPSTTRAIKSLFLVHHPKRTCRFHNAHFLKPVKSRRSYSRNPCRFCFRFFELERRPVIGRSCSRFTSHRPSPSWSNKPPFSMLAFKPTINGANYNRFTISDERNEGDVCPSGRLYGQT